MTIDTNNIATKDLHQYLVGSVAPRPIAFVSSVDEHGVINLAPYSFFNVFSSNPPIAVFSSNRRVANNSTKDTLHNVEATRSCVINVVTYDIVRQMALTSIDYPSEVNEFEKGGFTPIPSDLVKAPRVKESPVNMECLVKEVLPLGTDGGAGHLVICEIKRIHIDDRILDEEGRIDPDRIDLMGRMGRAYYTRASGPAIHKIFQPFNELGVGFDALPDHIRTSNILTGNEIAEIAALTELPTPGPEDLALIMDKSPEEIHLMAKAWIGAGEVKKAAAVLLA